MECKNCNACKLGFFKSKPSSYVCTGVKEPFVINNINQVCTEYENKKDSNIKQLDTSENILRNLVNVVNTLLHIVDCSSYEILNECKESMKQIQKHYNEDDKF